MTDAVVDGLRVGTDSVVRCWWCGVDPLYVAYHDDEWGQPVTDEHGLFERLALEGFQAGLSWLTILRKRDAFREVFAGFDPEAVAGFGDDDVARLMGDARIVRNRAKIEATVGNARAMLDLHDGGSSLWSLLQQHAEPGRPRPRDAAEVPAQTSASVALSRTLKKAGFRFVGPTTCYAAMQAIGLVDDHIDGCHVPGRSR